jgi:hypothetical protein
MWLTIGLTASVTVYLRESSLGLVLAGLVFLVVCRGIGAAEVRGAVAAGLVLAAAMAPWGIRNRQVTGQWVWLTTRAGISLYDGVGPTATGASDLGEIKQMPAVRNLGELEWNRYFLDASVREIRADPARVLRLAGAKLGRMWNPLPNVDTYQSAAIRLVAASWSIPTFALAVLGAVVLPAKRGREGLTWTLWMLLPGAYLTLLHSLFIGSVRYRLGATPMIEILAALAVVTILTRLRPGPAALEGVHERVV